jgi:uncharacterized membrane protein
MPQLYPEFDEHLNLIERHEQEFLEERSLAEWMGDSLARFAGGLSFICVHFLIFGAWIAIDLIDNGIDFPSPAMTFFCAFTLQSSQVSFPR